MLKKFIITVDTEGDFLWHTVQRSYGIRNISVKNAYYIERFQKLCRKYHFIPTYLVNYEMAFAEPFVSQARQWLKNSECEIGMHLHGWSTPPEYLFPYRRKAHNPYAGEYPSNVLFHKLERMTEIIERNFSVRPVSHRGGRWYIDSKIIDYLLKLGYIADCSVTPGVSWGNHIGYQIYGCDYRGYDNRPFLLGTSRCENFLCEIPMTIIRPQLFQSIKEVVKSPSRWKEITSKCMWLRPNGRNSKEMNSVVDTLRDKTNYLEFMIHSSELMPGGSPTFKNEASIEKLYDDMECLFQKIGYDYEGISLGDFAKGEMKSVLEKRIL